MSKSESQESGTRKRRGRMLAVAALVAGLVALGYFNGRGAILAALATGPEYHARFATVGGLRRGDEVRYGGLPVGRVRRVEIDAADPSRILVTFRVSDRTPVRTDTRASIVDATGAVTRHLALRSGRRDAPALPAGREVTTEVGPTLEEMLIGLTSVVQRMDTLLDAAVPLAHSDLFSRLERTSRRLDLMTAAVVRTSAQWGPGLVRAAGRLDTVLTRSDSLLAALNAATPELRSASGEALGMLQDTRALVGQLRAGASQGGGVDELMRNLTLATDNLSRLAAKLERNPASLLKTQRPMPKTAGPKLND